MRSTKKSSRFPLTSELALEIYFSRQLGFSLLAIGALSILLTGSVPLSSRLSEGNTNTIAMLHTPLTRRRSHYVSNRPQGSLRASHAHNNGLLPCGPGLLRIHHVDRDWRV